MSKDAFLIGLGKRITALRQEKNLSQTDLGNLLGRDRQAIHRIEKGQVNVSVYYLKEIAEALEMPLSEIVDF